MNASTSSSVVIVSKNLQKFSLSLDPFEDAVNLLSFNSSIHLIFGQRHGLFHTVALVQETPISTFTHVCRFNHFLDADILLSEIFCFFFVFVSFNVWDFSLIFGLFRKKNMERIAAWLVKCCCIYVWNRFRIRTAFWFNSLTPWIVCFLQKIIWRLLAVCFV